MGKNMKFIFVITLLLCVSLVSSQEDVNHTYRDIFYGPHNNQILDLYVPHNTINNPIVIFVHGGFWEAGDKADMIENMANLFLSENYIFASVNYRLADGKISYVDQAIDVMFAINWIKENISEFNGDPNNIILMGYSAGAQISALLSVDYRYGINNSLKCTCILDGSALDIPFYIKNNNILNKPKILEKYHKIFGMNVEDWQQASAINYLDDATETPRFILVYPNSKSRMLISLNFLDKLNLHSKENLAINAGNRSHSRMFLDIGRDEDYTLKLLTIFNDCVKKTAQ